MGSSISQQCSQWAVRRRGWHIGVRVFLPVKFKSGKSCVWIRRIHLDASAWNSILSSNHHHATRCPLPAPKRWPSSSIKCTCKTRRMTGRLQWVISFLALLWQGHLRLWRLFGMSQDGFHILSVPSWTSTLPCVQHCLVMSCESWEWFHICIFWQDWFKGWWNRCWKLQLHHENASTFPWTYCSIQGGAWCIW